jgi:hypothetical protein
MLAVVSQVESQIAAVRHKDPAAEEGSRNAAHCSSGEHHIPSQVKFFHGIRLGQSVTHLQEGYQQSSPARVQSFAEECENGGGHGNDDAASSALDTESNSENDRDVQSCTRSQHVESTKGWGHPNPCGAVYYASVCGGGSFLSSALLLIDPQATVRILCG